LRKIVQIGEREGHEGIGGRAAARVSVEARGRKGGAAQSGRVARLKLGAKLMEIKRAEKTSIRTENKKK
jgi:hypothetical protein